MLRIDHDRAARIALHADAIDIECVGIRNPSDRPQEFVEPGVANLSDAGQRVSIGRPLRRDHLRADRDAYALRDHRGMQRSRDLAVHRARQQLVAAREQTDLAAERSQQSRQFDCDIASADDRDMTRWRLQREEAARIDA